MRTGVSAIIAAFLTMIALAGCEQASAPPGTPGSVTLSVHGRMETGLSVSSH